LVQEEHDELAAIKMKKMQEFQRRWAAMQQKQEPKPKEEPDDMTLVRSKLTGRGTEVLNAALAQYPQATREVVSYIANLYRMKRLTENIPGEELYELFLSLGMRVRLDTSITYIKDGKRISLSEKLKR